jgi:hypothetical protein
MNATWFQRWYPQHPLAVEARASNSHTITATVEELKPSGVEANRDIDMKKINLALQQLKGDIEAAITPELKKEACQDAITFADTFLTGFAKELAVLMFTELEATIKE